MPVTKNIHRPGRVLCRVWRSVASDQLSSATSYHARVQLSSDQQKRGFDRRHRTTAQPDISDETDVWITSGNSPVRGKVTQAAGRPRSYLVETPSGVVRQNREHRKYKSNQRVSAGHNQNVYRQDPRLELLSSPLPV